RPPPGRAGSQQGPQLAPQGRHLHVPASRRQGLLQHRVGPGPTRDPAAAAAAAGVGLHRIREEPLQMSTATVPQVAATPSNSFGAGRVLLLVFGSIALLVALGLIAGGAAAIWGLGQRDSAGFVKSGNHRLSTSWYAFA